MLTFIRNVWQKNWKGKATLLFGAVIFLTASTALIYAIATREGDEGFMKSGEQELRWNINDIPVSCSHDDTVKEHHVVLYNAARAEINEKVGKVLIGPCIGWLIAESMPEFITGSIILRVADTDPDALEGVTVSSPFDGHAGGVTRYKFDKRDGHILGVAVLIDPELEKGLESRVWLHELGHVLGLMHDRRQDSVMYANANGRPRELSTTDVNHLQRAYK